MKDVGAVRKQQHIVCRVPARSIVRFRYDLQTGAMKLDGARLDDEVRWTARLVTRSVSGWPPLARSWTASCISRDVHCSADCMTDCGSRPDCSCSSMGTKESVVHLQHGSMRRKRCQRPPAVRLQAAVRLPDASTP